MTPAAPSIIPVLQKHLEELGSLWEQRQAALCSPDYLARDVGVLDRRIKAHLDGLMLGGESAIEWLGTQLESDDPWAVFAAGYILLSLKIPAAAERVTGALLQCKPEPLEGFRQALCHGPIDLVERSLREAIDSAPAPVAAAAWEALLYHGHRENHPARLAELLAHEDPALRRAGWRIIALLDSPDNP
jgi:uncharacterized protein (TIGR02270 family)